jgi:hypothetical protein
MDITHSVAKISPEHGIGNLSKGLTYSHYPLLLHIALVGPLTPPEDTSKERCKDACLRPRCLCVYVRRLDMHDADRDIPASTNGLQQLSPIASRFYSATACSMVARANR